MLEVQDLVKVYENKNKNIRAIDGISFKIREGGAVGILGPNGAGKTTTIKCICDLIIPTSGMITLNGVDTLKHPSFVASSISAVLEGNRNIYWRLTAEQNLEFFAGLMGRTVEKDRMDELIKNFDLAEKRKTQARFLSRGMQQKLAVACALIKNTPVLLLDEPTLGLDVVSSHSLRKHIKEMVTKSKKTLLLSTHDMGVVKEVCDRVIIINHGKIVTDDSVNNLLSLFRTRSYRFLIENNPGAIDAIKREFGVSVKPLNKKVEVLVNIYQEEYYFEFEGRLKSYGCKIDSVEEINPDFEEIFMKLVEEKDEQ